MAGGQNTEEVQWRAWRGVAELYHAFFTGLILTVVTRRGTGVTLTLRGVRFVSDAALDGIVTSDSKTGSVYAAVTLRGSDGSLRALVLTWNTNQAKGYAAARGSVDTRALLLVLPAP